MSMCSHVDTKAFLNKVIEKIYYLQLCLPDMSQNSLPEVIFVTGDAFFCKF